jgi:hypothetical protein
MIQVQNQTVRSKSWFLLLEGGENQNDKYSFSQAFQAQLGQFNHIDLLHEKYRRGNWARKE